MTGTTVVLNIPLQKPHLYRSSKLACRLDAHRIVPTICVLLRTEALHGHTCRSHGTKHDLQGAAPALERKTDQYE